MVEVKPRNWLRTALFLPQLHARKLIENAGNCKSGQSRQLASLRPFGWMCGGWALMRVLSEFLKSIAGLVRGVQLMTGHQHILTWRKQPVNSYRAISTGRRSSLTAHQKFVSEHPSGLTGHQKIPTWG